MLASAVSPANMANPEQIIFLPEKKAKETKDQLKEDGTHCCLLEQLRAALRQVTAPSPPLALPARAGERSAQEAGGCCSRWRYCQTA